ncbi:proteasome assembly chaperone 2 isoform X3 [Haemaphysalis longicornis]
MLANMFVPLPPFKGHQWHEYSLVLPVVSVGNAAQLAVDLLLSTLETELVGHIHSTALVPLVGGNPYRVGDRRLATACQVYVCHRSKLLVVQQRTPVSAVCGDLTPPVAVQNCRSEYRQFLTEWIQGERFRLVIMLSSCLSQYTNPADLPSVSDEIPVVLLLVYCSEGDNTPDAILLADRLDEWLHLCQPPAEGIERSGRRGPWQTPISWSLLFGGAPPNTIY